MKKKILILLSLTFILSACQKEEYSSQRHPEDNIKSIAKTEVKYKSKDKSNIISKVSVEDTKNLSNKEKDNKENISSNESSNVKNEQNNNENVEGTFTVEDITNLRSETNTDSSIVARLMPGDSVYRMAVEGEWSKVSSESYEGYILTELLVPEE